MKSVDYGAADVLAVLAKLKEKPSEKLEGETIEFKESLSTEQLSKVICSFANHRGGVVVVGVRDGARRSGQLVGHGDVDKEDVKKRIRGKIQSHVDFRVENIRFESKNYTAIFVSKSSDGPVTTSSGRVYVRKGRDSVPMQGDEIARAVKASPNYDWSADILERLDLSALDEEDVGKALDEYVAIRELERVPTKEKFLESIEVTKNGILTKAGLLFLGRADKIEEYLRSYEFRFSWKEGIELKINEIWTGNIWCSIRRAKAIFQKCVSRETFEFKENKYEVPNLDQRAFHEALLNAMVHRDYSLDGMISIEFAGEALSIVSPGLLYGGVTVDNIAFHDPRHRNKALARILMAYELVDRAGMGVARMGVQSLIYGRSFPKFEEREGCVRVSMQAEYIREAIFILTRGKKRLYAHDLILLNSIYDKTNIPLSECFELIQKIVPDLWTNLQGFVERWSDYVELYGSKKNLGIKVKDDMVEFFGIEKSYRTPMNSQKFVKLFQCLRRHTLARNDDICKHLGFAKTQSASRFLAAIEWIEKTGRGPSTQYKLKSDHGF